MSDSFIDAVLKQSAATQGGDDEEFLSEVEAAIDREDSKSKSKRYLLFLPCGAVLLALFLFPLFLWESSEPIAALAATNEELVKTSDSLAETQTRSAAVRETTESGEVRSSLDNGTDPSLIVASAGTISVDSLPGRGHGQVVPIVIDGNNKTQDRVIRRELPRESNSFDTTGVDKGEPFRVGEAILVENTPGPRYSELIDNVWTSPATTPLSTFSIDVDTASWTNVRNMIRNGAGLSAIPSDAVRIEEMINYFSWDYDQPEGDHPFALATEISDCPWNEEHQLLRIGIQGEEVFTSERPKANLVFLIDVSGSMDQQQKLPLVKQSIRVLTEELDEDDRISIVVYAGSEGLALPATPGSEKAAIHRAIKYLNAGGSTNGGAGIKLAYRLAEENRIEEGINRVILCTDGDFNVGVTGTEELAQLVETGADEKIAISVLGFGQDNLNDGMLETITNRGDGNYFYIDSFREARKVFLSDLMGTLVTIARDVKIQIEFNPAEVESYRLIGYA
ncbi:MAG: von Willebrand factor type A domain-containing protein, partial [Verrucomicrobiota bacterium]